MPLPNQNQIIQNEHDSSLKMKKVGAYGWSGSAAVMLKTNSSGEVVIDPTSLDTRFVNITGDTMTGNLGITKADPEYRLTDSGNSEYSRLLRSDTSNQFNLYNRVSTPAATSYQIEFAGTRQITTPYNIDLDADSFSLSVWCKPVSIGLNSYTIFGATNAGYTGGYWILIHRTDRGGVTLQYQGASGALSYTTPSANMTAGAWHHIVMVKNGTNFKLYQNNVKISDETLTFLGAFTTAPVTIAGIQSANYFNGTIDEPTIWSSVLSEAEISTLYNSGAGLYGSATAGLVVGYHFNEGTGTSLTDYSGLGNTGTLSGTVTWATGVKAVPTDATTSEASIITSINGVAQGEVGIHTFGHSSGQSILQGSNVWFKDSNGNELFTTAQVASAVNYLSLSNSATSNGVPISALGDDTNINLLLASKGVSGTVKLNTNFSVDNYGNASITPTLASTSDVTPALTITKTFPTLPAATVYGANWTFTGAGSHTQPVIAFNLDMSAGYTGGRSVRVFSGTQSSAGSGADGLAFSTAYANYYGIFSATGSTGSGHNVGIFGQAFNGLINHGMVGKSGQSGTGANIGVTGIAYNTSGTQLAGYFGLHNSQPTFTSAALIADNGAQAVPIFLGRDNGTTVFSIADGGAVLVTGTGSVGVGAVASENVLTMAKGGAGSPVTLTATGVDAAVGIDLITKAADVRVTQGGLRISGALKAVAASTFALDVVTPATGECRVLAIGPDTGTPGFFKFSVCSSDATEYSDVVIFRGPVANSVNQFTYTAATTGTNPIISATGSDTNIGLAYTTKGTGTHVFTGGASISSGAVAIPLSVTASAVSTRINVDNTNGTPNSGFGIKLNGTATWSIAALAGYFTWYNDVDAKYAFTIQRSAVGQMTVGNSTTALGQFGVNVNTAATIGLVVKGFTSQSASLQEWWNSSSTVLASINAAGEFVGTLNTAVVATTQAANDNSTKVATTAYVQGELSGWELVYDYEVTGSAVSDVTASSLDGNDAEVYMVKMFLINPTGTGTSVNVHPNADTTAGNYFYQYLYAQGSTVGAGSATTNAGMLGGAAGANDIGYAQFEFYAKSGQQRIASSHMTRNTGSNVVLLFGHGGWTNTADNITSLKFISTVASAIGVGSRFMIWKKI